MDSEWKAREPDHLAYTSSKIHELGLYSWNIDFRIPFASSRMLAALSHLQHLITTSASPSQATVIYLQECIPSDLDLIAANPWIREHFAITDISSENWASSQYGTITLIDLRLPIRSCFRVHYSHTRMERDGLFIDVAIQGNTLRLCNTHLESLALEPPFRIPQMQICASFMRETGVDAAILAGDLNAVQEFDKSLHVENGLKDAYLELGNREDDVEGHTWGQQAARAMREEFGTSRMDKVYFGGLVELLSFETFGAGVMVQDPAEGAELLRLGFDEPWITDHLGIKAIFRFPSKSNPSSVM